MARDSRCGRGSHFLEASMTATPSRGEIWSCRLPGKADDPHQPRPAMVISADVRNRLADDVIVIPIFSRGAFGPTHIPLAAGQGGIKKPSVLFCEEITTIDRGFVVRGPWGDRVEDDVLRAAVRAVRRALGETLPEPL
ncbi:MAG: type II toxin-antitoxin system PemK/MazF family toxin [Chloroflexi bacterium]|nr:MAG: type II toxin-antitoxin system PemK/MazF family toxin [Chloroflexota bacterium]TMC28255.1 MAG: type II toxin-antitoxin system PemK/MazF family toxin [Chloroflexota bacterium]TMC33041.1 MAG: type II toxin-antitoxin system PemK/MazF family toxin [Chloroflexota bacterium]TME36989.1 MAG: type II toxin-antitoxin system PemK/MazF family toxin [Chloroflexota bacterium]